MDAKIPKVLSLAAIIVSLLLIQACGGTALCFLNTLNVSASTSNAIDHTALAPGNSVHFIAFGSGSTAGCSFTQSNLMNVNWSVSDPQNVTISNAKDQTYGVATCINATTGPVTVTATLPRDLNNGHTASGSATMTCK